MGLEQTPLRKKYNKLFWFTVFPTVVIYMVIVTGLLKSAEYMASPANRTAFFGSFFIVSACLFLTLASILCMYAKFLTQKMLAAYNRQPIVGMDRFALFGLGGILYVVGCVVLPVYAAVLLVMYVIDNRGLKTKQN